MTIFNNEISRLNYLEEHRIHTIQTPIVQQHRPVTPPAIVTPRPEPPVHITSITPPKIVTPPPVYVRPPEPLPVPRPIEPPRHVEPPRHIEPPRQIEPPRHIEPPKVVEPPRII